MVSDAAEFLEANDGAYAIVPTSLAPEIQGSTGAHIVGQVQGFDYADGDAYDLTVLKAGSAVGGS